MMTLRFSIPAASLLVLAACSNEPLDTPHPEFGAAVRNNMAVHILPVEAAAESPEAPWVPGARANVGMDRYMKGEVTKPQSGGTSFQGDSQGQGGS